MKKIGLLSFPRYYNYGTFLQLYALETTIEKLGFSCEVIDYDRDNTNGEIHKATGFSFIRTSKSFFLLSISDLMNL